LKYQQEAGANASLEWQYKCEFRLHMTSAYCLRVTHGNTPRREAPQTEFYQNLTKGPERFTERIK